LLLAAAAAAAARRRCAARQHALVLEVHNHVVRRALQQHFALKVDDAALLGGAQRAGERLELAGQLVVGKQIAEAHLIAAQARNALGEHANLVVHIEAVGATVLLLPAAAASQRRRHSWRRPRAPARSRAPARPRAPASPG
jgi:hypothetical protein